MSTSNAQRMSNPEPAPSQPEKEEEEKKEGDQNHLTLNLRGKLDNSMIDSKIDGKGFTPACRICLEDSDGGPLLSVCNCDGSCKHVHRDCLQKWIETSQSTRCELCLAEYTHDYVRPTPAAVVLQRGQSQALCYRIFMNVLLWIAITSLGSCGVLHGMDLAVGVWRGRQFRDDLVFRCLIANVYHACIWVAMFKLKNNTAVVSFVWLVSVIVGVGVFCYYYNTYNVQMTESVCLNFALSLFGIGLSNRSFQKWYQKWYQKCCQKCYKRRYGQGQVYHGPPMNTNEGQGTNVLEVEMVVAEAETFD